MFDQLNDVRVMAEIDGRRSSTSSA